MHLNPLTQMMFPQPLANLGDTGVVVARQVFMRTFPQWESASLFPSSLVTVANEATDTTCFIGFFTAATGDLGPKTNANLTYNSNTGAFSIGTTAALTAGTLQLGGTEATVTIGGVAYDIHLVVHDEGATDITAGFHKHSDTAAAAPTVEFARSRGSEASETVVSSGDDIGRISFLAHDGTDYERAAEILVEVDGTPGSGDMPGRIKLRVSPDGSGTPATAVTVQQDKTVLFAATISPEADGGADLGTPAVGWGDVNLDGATMISWNGGDVTITHSTNALDFAGASSGYTFDSTVTLTNTGLHLLDTNASHDLIIAPGSDLTADHTLTLTTGDADRTVTIGANVTLNANTTVDHSTVSMMAGAGLTGGGTIAASRSFAVDTTATFAWTGIHSFNQRDLVITNIFDDASEAVLTLDGDRATPTDGDEIYLRLRLSDSAGTQTEFSRITVVADDVTNATEDGSLHFSVLNVGVLTDYVTLSAARFKPTTDAGCALGDLGLGWNGIYLASTTTLNWGSGEVIFGASGADTLYVSGATLFTLGTSCAVACGTVELGHASDTTLARSSAGNVTIEGNVIYRAGGTDVPVTDGGTGLSAITALSVWVANSANTITEVTPGAGNSIRINAGGTAWEAFTPSSSVPTTITIANEATDTTCFPLFVTAATGDLGPKTNASLTFNSNTASLACTTFVGALTGNASTATALQTARTIGGTSFDGTANIVPATITAADEATDTTCFLAFFTAATGDLGPKTNANLAFNSSTNLVTLGGALTVGTSNSITCGTIELGAASDTTLSRSAAGVIQVEGKTLAFVKLGSATASTSSSLDFGNLLTTTYAGFYFVVDHLVAATDGAILTIRTSTDGGSTYDSGASNYSYHQWHFYVGGSTYNASDGATAMNLDAGSDAANTDFGVSGIVEVVGVGSGTARPGFFWRLQALNSVGTRYSIVGAGRREAAADIDSVRFIMSSGNIASGKVTLYGIIA